MAEEDRRSGRCVACISQRKGCREDCIMKPYFRTNITEFRAALRLFGLRNIKKLIRDIGVQDRSKAVDSIIWEASIWQQDPINGPLGCFNQLQQQNSLLRDQIHDLNLQLQNFTKSAPPPPPSPQLGFQNLTKSAPPSPQLGFQNLTKSVPPSPQLGFQNLTKSAAPPSPTRQLGFQEMANGVGYLPGSLPQIVQGGGVNMDFNYSDDDDNVRLGLNTFGDEEMETNLNYVNLGNMQQLQKGECSHANILEDRTLPKRNLK